MSVVSLVIRSLTADRSAFQELLQNIWKWLTNFSRRWTCVTAEDDRCLILFCACSDLLPCVGSIPVTKCLLILYISWTLGWKCCKYGRLSLLPLEWLLDLLWFFVSHVGCKLRHVLKCQCSDTQSSEWRVKSIPKSSCVSDIHQSTYFRYACLNFIIN
jgi:hypothetical protein